VHKISKSYTYHCPYTDNDNRKINAQILTISQHCLSLQSKLFDHDNMKLLKKLLDELEGVLDQVETELQRRAEETPGSHGNDPVTKQPETRLHPSVCIQYNNLLPHISLSLDQSRRLVPEEGGQSWLCGDFFSMADISLAVTLHRLKFLGLSRRYWGNGNRGNLEAYYERVVMRPAFRRVLGLVNNILISAVLPVALRVARKNAPAILGTTLLLSILGGASYLAFLLMKRRLIL